MATTKADMEKWSISRQDRAMLDVVGGGNYTPPVYTPVGQNGSDGPAGQNGPDGEPEPTKYKRLLTGMTSAQRKEYPIITGCLDYFPDALALVSHVSYKGNQKHNPGQPLHHARGKSSDHLDCIGRHLTERREVDGDTKIIHMANECWRSLAELQEMLEKQYGLSLPYGATAPGVELK